MWTVTRASTRFLSTAFWSTFGPLLVHLGPSFIQQQAPMPKLISPPADLIDVTDYIIWAMGRQQFSLGTLKLQKLLFYSQAWHLALQGVPLFEGRFQAWVHGPLLVSVHERFKHSHSRFSPVTSESISRKFDSSSVPSSVKEHLDEVLDAYGQFTSIQLIEMTRGELPWIQARGDLEPAARCETEISEETMASFYQTMLSETS